MTIQYFLLFLHYHQIIHYDLERIFQVAYVIITTVDKKIRDKKLQ